jgi:hypothetical protein
MKGVRLGFMSVIGAALCSSCFAQQRTVALTFDDLPAAGAACGDEAERYNRSILMSPRKRAVRATGLFPTPGRGDTACDAAASESFECRRNRRDSRCL